MTLWIIAAIAGAVLLAGIAFLVMRRQDAGQDDAWERPRHSQPWDKRPDEPEGTRMATVPPPAGVPILHESDEFALVTASDAWDLDEEPTGPVPRILLAASGGTHAGQHREHNEDAFLVLTAHDVYAVADGMGGYAAGEVAARTAVETIRDTFAAAHFIDPQVGLPARAAELEEAVRHANQAVRAIAKADPNKRGMGTTLVAARFSPGKKRVYLAHVGDSRCYRLRDGRLTALTVDHTLEAVGIRGPSAGKLSRAVGVFDAVDVEMGMDEPQVGDLYLLCSDGLYKMVPENDFARLLMNATSLGEAVDALIAAANDRGGHDNVTVVLVRVDPPDARPDESGEHRLPMA